MEPVAPDGTDGEARPRSVLVRFLMAFAVIGVVLVAPMFLIGAAFGVVAAMAFPFGTMAGLFASTGDGRAVALRLMPVLVVGGTLTAMSAGTWWWVPVLALSGVAVGLLTARGWAIAIIEVAICVTTADPVRGVRQIVLYAVFVGVGYLVGILVAKLAGAPEQVDRQPLRHVSGLRAAVLGGAALAAAGGLALVAGWTKGFWLPMSFLILLEYYVTDEEDVATDGTRMILYRFVGTVGGMALLVPVVMQVGGPAQFVLIVGLLAAAMVIPDTHYWASAALITAAVVMFSSIGADPLAVGRERVLATVVAGLLLLVTVAGFTWVRVEGRPPGPAVAPR